MDIKDIEVLTYNSFFCSRIIAHFLSGCDNNQVKFDLVFLVLPVILKSESRQLLKTANSRSTVYSTFLSKPEGRISLGGLDKRLEHLKPLTQSSLVVGAKHYGIHVNDFIKIGTPLDYNLEVNALLKEYYRASFFLGKVFSTNSLFNIYLKLGLKHI